MEQANAGHCQCHSLTLADLLHLSIQEQWGSDSHCSDSRSEQLAVTFQIALALTGVERSCKKSFDT